jgi:hypothetical protein
MHRAWTLRAVDQTGSPHASLFSRLGGREAVEAVVRFLHDRIVDNLAVDAARDGHAHEIRRADVAGLTALIGGPVSEKEPGLGVLDWAAPEVVAGLRDALWFLGVSTPLTEEITDAVRNHA